MVRYGVALLAVVVAMLLRWVLWAVLGQHRPYLALFGGVALAVWFSGWRPASLTAVLGFIAVNISLATSQRGFSLDTLFLLEFVVYALSVGLIIFFGENLHVAVARAEKETAERKQVETALAQEKELLTVTLASIGDGVVATDARGNVTFLNPEAERLTGWRNAEAAGLPLPEVFRIINEKTRVPVENPVEKVLRTGAVVGLANHTILISKTGREIPIDDSAAPIRLADGSLSGVVLVFRDFTQQRRAQENQTHLAAIVEHSGDVILTKDLNSLIQSWNSSAERLFGYRAEEVIGKPITILFPPERVHEEDEILGRLRQGKPVERLETIRVAKDGRRIPVAVSISPLKDSDGELVGASKVVHDITDLVAAREALVREKELLATTLASIGDAVIVTDPEGRVTFMNAEAERLTRWASADAKGRALPEVFRIVNEETRLTVENPVEKVLRLGGVVGLANHTVLIAKDGTETPIDDSAAPIREPNGPLFGVVLVFRDFTERKRAEETLRAAHEQLASRAVHLEKLIHERTARLQETVNELEHVSYSIAHDMRAPLRAMSIFAGLLAEQVSSGEGVSSEARDYSQRILAAAARLDKLIQDALHYTKTVSQDMAMEPVDLDRLIRGLIEIYPNLQPDRADIRIGGGLPVVHGNEALLTQCFANLLGNAVKFVPAGTRPVVRVWADLQEKSARISVQDNGVGIPPHLHKRLFGMFQKLNDEYEGTGIGLAIVRKVAERMGGKVGVESEPGKGSRFWVELPLSKTESEPSA